MGVEQKMEKQHELLLLAEMWWEWAERMVVL